MANPRELQSRMKSIKDTMKITNAMYMISSTKLQKAKRELEETEPFFFTIQNMVARILRHIPDMESRYLDDGKGSEGKKRGFLVVTADKGLAGSYNHDVLKLAEEEIGKSSEWKLYVVGELGRQYFYGRKIPVDEHFLYTAQNPTMGRARIIAGTLIEQFRNKELDEIYMIYTSMKNSMQTEVKMERLLPFSHAKYAPKIELGIDVLQEEFLFRPSPMAVLKSLVPNYMNGYIYGALVESYCSEHQARMMAMQTANDSAQAVLQELAVEYNRLRQARITQEITEVVSGAKAQKGKKKGDR